ncbi:MAG: PAS domain S-box protein [Myxococcales bacterium]|nr:PAS domain S-box protein [Myxococcales bacterium]
MKPAPIPANDAARLQKLRDYDVLDTPPEPAFDALTALAAHIAGVPIALVSLVDVDRQWFKSRYGLEAPQTPRDVSFCGHVVAAEVPLVVPDAHLDARFADNPLVTGGPHVRFYAGVPLRTPDGFVLGTLCAIDQQARVLTSEQQALLTMLAQQVVDQLELRRQGQLLRARQASLHEELRQTAELASRLQSILGSANLGIIETTPAGVIREFNAAAERMLGYSAAELVGTMSPAIFHVVDEVVARARELTAELGLPIEPGFDAFIAKARLGVADERDWTYVRKGGARFPVHLSITARRDAAGEITGYMGIASDVSERRAAEEALRQRTALLKLGSEVARAFTLNDTMPRMLQACAEAIVSNLDAAFARIWTLNTAQHVLELKASAGQYTHLDGPHARVPVGQFKIGLIAQERLPHITNSVLDDPRVGDREWARREGLVSFAGYPLVLGDRLVGVLAMFSRHALPPSALEALGVVATHAAVGIDRKEADARLRESEARSRSIIDSAVDAVVTIDERGRIDHVNPAVERLFGYAASELLGENVGVLMPSPDRQQADGSLADDAATGHRKLTDIGRDVTGVRKDGSTFPGELAVSEFTIEGRKFFTGVVRDITDRKRVERLQSEFISTVSHELRTPLTSIRGALGLVAGGVTGELPKEAQEYLDIALSNSDRLVRLINDILDIEKMQSGSMEFRLRTTELGGAIRSAMSANEAFASAHRVRLVLGSTIPAGEVLVDPDRLAQVLTNLISNAAKFSPTDGVVELSVEHVGAVLRVNVRDHGPGIPEEFRGRIFQRFAQADASSTRQKGGTGLGLSISKAIVEKMHGRVGFESAPGGGTIFFFELPWLPPVGDAGNAGAARVLVCEDDPDVSRVLDKLLSNAGFTVHVAPTLERARRLLAMNTYDVITLDMVLADGDGAVLIGEVRATEATRLTPIIVVSGSAGELGRAAMMVSDVIIKPFDEGRLLAAVTNAVATCRSDSPRLLHVEDDEDIRRIVKRTLPGSWTVTWADSLQAAKKALSETTFDVVLLDLSLPDGAGHELIGLVGLAQVIIFSASDASSDLSQRVAAALVKSRVNPVDVRDTIISIIARARPTGRPS